MLERFQSKRARRERKAENEEIAALREELAELQEKRDWEEKRLRKRYPDGDPNVVKLSRNHRGSIDSLDTRSITPRDRLNELIKKRSRRQVWFVAKIAILIFILFQVSISCSG